MKYKRWTPVEIKILKDNYSSKTINEIIPMLGNAHTWGSIAQKANELGITDRSRGKIQWSDDEIQFLKNNFWNMTSYELAAALDKKRTIVRMKYKELGLSKMQMEYWDKRAVKFLRKNYKIMGDVEIAEILQSVFPKKKVWKKNHIAKKRMQLNLNRTKKQIAKILETHHKPGGRMFTILKNSCSLNMTNRWVADRIAWRDPELAEYIIKNHPELIEIKRNQLKLQRKINKHENRKAA